MGATTFTTTAAGKSAAEAFASAKDQAAYENGHGGYTGTIAEKDRFVVVVPNAGETPQACAERLMDDDNSKVSDKWGPAGCIDTGPSKRVPGARTYLFFGWASM